MSTPFNLEGPSLSWTQSSGVVTLVEGASFCVCTQTGDIFPEHAQGLFFRDARIISRWELYLDGQLTEPLSVQPTDPYAGVFVGRPHPRPGQADGHLVVMRRRYVGQGMREDVTVRNVGTERTAVTVTLAVESDFADLFAVKEGRVGSTAQHHVTIENGQLGVWPADRPDHAGTVVRANQGDPIVAPTSLTFRVVIEPRGEWHTCLEAVPVVAGQELPPRFGCGEPVEHSSTAQQLAAWRDGSARISADRPSLTDTFDRTAADLGSLRIFDPKRPELPVVAAGAPWYMTLFGRDSLLTSSMALLMNHRLAIGTLHVLAEMQGAKVDLLSEEEPGKILHEMRHGTGIGSSDRGGNSVYYGTADATPLFVMLVGELYRWGFGAEVRALLPNVDRALEWITEYGDRDGDGFVEYQRATDKGLVNQGWKDSWDAISFDDGRFADPPIALCEVQAYVYGAYQARVTIARAEGDVTTAELYTKRAAEFRQAFNERFWLPDRGYVAFALDRHKRPVDSATSNMGHCLWTGILDDDKARQVADHLLSPELFSGWGVRTLSTAAGRYNPVSYHNGSVWPHDTAIVAGGLARYGFTAHAERVSLGLLDAAEQFGGRLPELFCGFDRDEFTAPVSYPASCSPQAWAAAAPLLVARSLLGFTPQVQDGVVRVAPSVPAELGELWLRGVPLGDGRVTVVARGTEAQVSGVPDGARLQRG
jgi:glycogen debranching enzyme